MLDPAKSIRILLRKMEMREAIEFGVLRLIVAALFGFAPAQVCSLRIRF
jgi:hypothetical protein